MSKAYLKNKKNIHRTEKEKGMTYDFCTDNSKECLKRNKFYNQIRKDLMGKKLKKYFNNEVKK
ncbi:MAG: hypothetical protein ACFE8L_10100 [Candidatus Hodarchaeota archaeon]